MENLIKMDDLGVPPFKEPPYLVVPNVAIQFSNDDSRLSSIEKKLLRQLPTQVEHHVITNHPPGRFLTLDIPWIDGKRWVGKVVQTCDIICIL